MIIFRYLLRQLLTSTTAVCFVLLLVFMSSSFVKYLKQAALGRYDAEVLFAFMGYRFPEFLELLLPLSFFLAILLTYGRLYLDSEMTVLSSSGVGRNRILGYTMVGSLLVAMVVGWLSLSVSPSGQQKFAELILAQEQRGELSSMPAKNFQRLSAKRGVAYAEEVREGKLHDVFFVEAGSRSAEHGGQVLMLAESGYQKRSEDLKDNFLVLENGYQIEGVPGRAEFRITEFEEFGKRLAETKQGWKSKQKAAGSVPTSELWSSGDPKDKALLHKRLSWPVMVLILTIAAIPLSKTSPRQGRYLKLLPAILLFVIYWLAVDAAGGKVGKGELGPLAGIWSIHLVFLLVSLAMFYGDRLRQLIGRKSTHNSAEAQ